MWLNPLAAQGRHRGGAGNSGVNVIRAVADGYAAQGYLAVAFATFHRVQPGVELGYAEGHEDRMATRPRWKPCLRPA